MACIKIIVIYLCDKQKKKTKGTQRLLKRQDRRIKKQLQRSAVASVGRGTNLKEMKTGRGEGKDGIITEAKEMDKKTEGKGTEA